MSEKIAVIWAGTMGSGIAQKAVEAGYDAVNVDMDDVFIERGTENIKKYIAKKEKGATR